MNIPSKYIIRNLFTRRLTTGLTVLGVSLVVFVFTAVLMMAGGLRKTMVATGSAENVIVLRKSALAEISSIIGRDEANIIRTLPHIARSIEGRPLVSGEVVVVVNLTYTTGGYGNVTVRGLSREGIQMRPQVMLTAGRMFQWGSREIVVGSSIAKRFQGVGLGSKIKFGGDEWSVVGIISSDGSGFDSEVWGDVDQLAAAFNRPVFSTIVARLDNPASFEDFRDAFRSEQRLQYLDIKREKQFYDEQSEDMAMFIRILGLFVTLIFSAGAMIGAMITMYAAVSNRTVEIGTLRALGFRRRNILFAFFLESVMISAVGGVIGIVFASGLEFLQISMINFSSFAELAFRFALSPGIVISSLIFSFVMGFVGGFLPAVRASRLNIVNALRSS